MDVAKPISPWKQVSLGSLASFRNGLNYTKEARDRGGLPIVGVKDFQNRVTLETEGLEELDASQVDCGETTIEKGDILFVRSNGNRELIGRSMFVATKPARPTTYSGFSIRLRFHSNAVHPRFFAYLFRGPVIRNTLSSQGGGTNISNLNQGILANLQVPLAPLPSQRRIASILGAYDDLIEVNRRRIAVLEEMARRLFDEWFVYFRFPGHEGHKMVETENGILPEGWRWSRLDEMLVLQRGFDLPSAERREGKYPIITGSGVGGFHVTGKVKAPGVVTGRSGTIGNVFLIHQDFWPLNTALYVREFRKSSPLHAYHLLRSLDLKGHAVGAAVPTLNRNHVHGVPVADPPDGLMARFEVFAAECLGQVETITKTNSKLVASRDLLLPRLISGELSVAAAEDELEAAA